MNLTFNKILIWLFFLSLPATAVKVGGLTYLRPWILIGMLMTLSLLIKFFVNSFKLKIYKSDYGLYSIFLFLLLCLFNAIFFNNSKSLNYLFAYITVFFISIFLIRTFLNSKELLKSALDANSMAVLIISIYSVIDVMLVMYVHVSPSEFLNLFDRGNATANILGIRVSRAYGLSVEPAVLSIYLISLGSLGLWWHVKNTKNYYIYAFIFFIALLLTFSASAAFASFASLFSIFIMKGIPYLLNSLNRLKIKKLPYFMITIASSVFLFAMSNSTVFKKLSNPTSSRSGVIRLERLEIGIENAQNAGIFGNGLGWTTLKSGLGGSYNNWYLDLVSDLGWLGLFLILVYFFHSFRTTYKNYKFLGFLPLFSVICGIYVFLVFGQFFEPHIFILFSLMIVIINNKNNLI
jgi:hypothetical protein